MRRLEVSPSGYWYVILTIILGVVALMTGNNVHYLIESLLLSGLIYSGVLSERSISAIDLKILRRPAIAQTPTEDQFIIENTKKFSLFCIEIGEWKNGKFISCCFLPKLKPKSQLLVRSSRTFDQRGRYTWEGIAIATSFPYGFAKKIKIINQPGERIIWPLRLLSKNKESDSTSARIIGPQFSEGEVRAYVPGEDMKDVIWTLSAKGGDWMTRIRKSNQRTPEVVLDLRNSTGEDFEKKVQLAAQPFYQLPLQDLSGSLTLIGYQGKQRFSGRTQILDQLAVVGPDRTAFK